MSPTAAAGEHDVRWWERQMGLDLVYTGGRGERVVRLTDDEWACVERLRAVAPGPIDAVFNVLDFGRPVSVTAADLVAAVDGVMAILRTRPDLQPATYQMRPERLPGGDGAVCEWGGSGAISGVRLPGEMDVFVIHVGPDRCELERVAVGPDGRGRVVGREDLRGRTQIQTETLGRVDFRRRPAGAGLRKKLAGLRDFLAGVGDEPVTKVLC